MIKQIAYGEEGRQYLKAGVDKLANAVKVTLGPKGKTVILSRQYGSPTIIDDGVTIAREIELKDPYENMGAQLVREAASKTNDIAGDGTTTATILTQAIYAEGVKNITAGANPTHLKKGIDYAVKEIVKELKRMAKKVDNSEMRTQIATISSNDPHIGKLIADAMDKVGKEGVITIEEGKTAETEMELVEGMQFDRGYLSPYFATNPEKMDCVLKDCYILISDKVISSIDDILPILQKISAEQKSLLVIAEDVTGQALATLVVNKLRGQINCCAIKAPGYGERRKESLEDIAALTSAEVITKDKGMEVDKTTILQLGNADSVIISKDNSTIVSTAGDKELIQKRISQIKKQIEDSSSDYDIGKLEERLAKLAGGVAVIKVGAATETEMKAKKSKVEDARNATIAAQEEGIIQGGGVALIRAAKVLDDVKFAFPDELTGINIVKKAVFAPLRIIAENSGKDGSIVINEVENNTINVGFNADNNTYVDVFEAGIIDPVKVTRTALENAGSIAGTLLTTEALVADRPTKQEIIPEGAGGNY